MVTPPILPAAPSLVGGTIRTFSSAVVPGAVDEVTRRMRSPPGILTDPSGHFAGVPVASTDARTARRMRSSPSP